MKKSTSLKTSIARFFSAGLAVFAAVLPLRAGDLTNAAPVSATNSPPSTLFDYNHYADWVPPAQNNASLTTQISPVSLGDPYTGLATGTLAQRQATTAYQQALADGMSIRYENNVVSAPAPAPAAPASPNSSALAQQQKLSLQLAPQSQVSLSGNVHLAASPADPYGNEAVTKGVGLETVASLPLQAQLDLQAATDQVSGYSATARSAQTQTMQAQLTQPIGPLPVKVMIAGSQSQTVSAGATSQSPSFEQALEWKIRPEDSLKLGVREMQYVEMTDAQYSNSLYADFSHQLASNLTWHSYADLLHMEGMDAVSSTTSSNAGPLQNEAFTFATGPSIKLQNDLSARVEFSNTWDKNNQGGPSTEHRVSVSVNGKF